MIQPAEKKESKVDKVEQAAKITGIDVSKYQGTVDFEKVKAAGARYVFVRATEGITYQDPDFKSNFSAAHTAGLTVGAYHFYETDDDPAAQLKNYTDMVSLQQGDLPPVVDIEKLHDNDQANLIDNLKAYLNGLEAHYGVKPIIYTGLDFANEYITEFGDYPLWLAEYEVDQPTVPKGWSDWTFWQWSQTGTVEGITGNVDADRFNGDAASFGKILIK
ncbi:hypothetical protein BGP75_20270 [Motiliproteus sp. MSK22-1]|nr:hypothetical protein BGP75_20270 [Motiliproteus sp. MSK22-1]